jgi:hypothetical protein
MNAERAIVFALVAFAGFCGVAATVGVLLVLLDLAAQTAGALAGVGIGVSIPLARKGLRK